MSGLCETCIAPGNCCRSVALSGGAPGPHGEKFDQPMSHERAEHLALLAGLPFRPHLQDGNGIWRWWCPALQPNGRCSIYEDRPKLCRDYKAGSDPLCVHHWPRPLDDEGTGGTSPELIEGTEKPADS